VTPLHSLRRALRASQASSQELGDPPTYTSHQYAHALGQLRHVELQRARRLVPRMLGFGALGGAAMAIATTTALGAIAAAILAAALITLAFFPGDQLRQPWQQWRQTRRYLIARLRDLGPEWTVLWDRWLHAAPTPVTVALGPSGLWLLWTPEPEWATQRAAPILEQLMHEMDDTIPHTGLTVHAASFYDTGDVDRAVNLMIAGAPQAGADELREWAQHLHLTTIQEPVVAPDR